MSFTPLGSSFFSPSPPTSSNSFVASSESSYVLGSQSPRKRGRCDSFSDGPPEKQQALDNDDTYKMDSPRVWKHDEDYYMEDGSCVLLVEDTLFNVHRSILSKDTSTFGTMFTLPQGGRPTEGRSDDKPIVLSGDTVAEFRHFLWALYALPPELTKLTCSAVDLTQLIDIARIANKYAFKSVETWALDAIQEYVNRKPSPIFAFMSQPATFSSPQESKPSSVIENTEQLTRLFRLAKMCNHDRLLNTMVGLLRGLMVTSLRYAYLAMTLADELNLKALRGAAYMEVMQKAVVIKHAKIDLNLKPGPASPQNALESQSTGEGDVDEQGRLVVSPAQQLRLLSGYYRLTGTWERLRMTPPQFDHAPSCGATWHQPGCTQSWLEFWKEKTRIDPVLSLGLADVLGRLRQVQKEYDRWGSATYMHHDCRQTARRSIIEIIKKVEESLPDFFSD